MNSNWKNSLLCRPVIDQNLYYTGMKYTTATVATALCNVLPAFVFLLAWVCRYISSYQQNVIFYVIGYLDSGLWT